MSRDDWTHWLSTNRNRHRLGDIIPRGYRFLGEEQDTLSRQRRPYGITLATGQPYDIREYNRQYAYWFQRLHTLTFHARRREADRRARMGARAFFE